MNKLLAWEARQKKYIEMYWLNVNNETESYMQNWVENVQYFVKNQREFNNVDIRKYLVEKKEKFIEKEN